MFPRLICERSFRVCAVGVAAALSACLLAPATAHAQTDTQPTTQAALPSAESIIEKSIEATGGREAYKKHRTRMMKGKLEMGQGMQGSMETYQARPNKMYTSMSMGGMSSEEGVLGDVAWQKHSMMGVRIKDGAEKAASLRSADFDFAVNWREHYSKVETLEKVDLEGKPAYKVKISPAEGNDEIRYFDVESGLHVKTEMKVENPTMGEMTVELLMSDYTESDGVKTPRKMTQRVMGQELVVIIEELKHDVEIPEDKFALPEDVKALIEKPETP